MTIHQLTDEKSESLTSQGDNICNVIWDSPPGDEAREANGLLFDVIGWAAENQELLGSVSIRRERLTEYLGFPPNKRVGSRQDTHVWVLGWVSQEDIFPIFLYSGVTGIHVDVLEGISLGKVVLFLRELKSKICRK